MLNNYFIHDSHGEELMAITEDRNRAKNASNAGHLVIAEDSICTAIEAYSIAEMASGLTCKKWIVVAAGTRFRVVED